MYSKLVASAPAKTNGSPVGELSGRSALAGLPEQDPLNIDVAFVYSPTGRSSQRLMQNGATLQTGDHYKIVIMPDKDCYMYLFQVDSAGRLYMLFPLDDLGITATNPVGDGEPYFLPGAEDSFILDEQTGLEKIFLLASHQKDPVVEQLRGYFSGNTAPDLRKKAEEKLGVYLYSKQRVTETSPGEPLVLSDQTSVTASKIESLNSSRVYEFSFQHK